MMMYEELYRHVLKDCDISQSAIVLLFYNKMYALELELEVFSDKRIYICVQLLYNTTFHLVCT